MMLADGTVSLKVDQVSKDRADCTVPPAAIVAADRDQSARGQAIRLGNAAQGHRQRDLGAHKTESI